MNNEIKGYLGISLELLGILGIVRGVAATINDASTNMYAAAIGAIGAALYYSGRNLRDGALEEKILENFRKMDQSGVNVSQFK